MIVLDASTLVSAAMNYGSVPDQAVRFAFEFDQVAISSATWTELVEVLARPALQRFIVAGLREHVLTSLRTHATMFAPAQAVTDCRDPKDNKVLELALASGADVIVSSDRDLLVLHSWRGVCILSPAAYLAEAGRVGP